MAQLARVALHLDVALDHHVVKHRDSLLPQLLFPRPLEDDCRLFHRLLRREALVLRLLLRDPLHLCFAEGALPGRDPRSNRRPARHDDQRSLANAC